jgi:hypothetical protein
MVQLAFVQFKEDDMTAVESTVNAGFIPVCPFLPASLSSI